MVSLAHCERINSKLVCRLSEMLVAVDGSRHSEKIVDVACAFAKRMSVSIMLMYVSSYPDLVNEYIEMVGRNPSPRAAQYVERAEEVTSKLFEKIQTEGIKCRVVLETGDPAEKIVRQAADDKADLIVVGFKGLHGVDKIRSLGSVARRVVENSSCPVLIARGDDL